MFCVTFSKREGCFLCLLVVLYLVCTVQQVCGQGSFPKGTYWVPHDVNYYGQVSDCGLNIMITGSGTLDYNSNAAVLNAAAANNLRVIFAEGNRIYWNGWTDRQHSLYEAEDKLSIQAGVGNPVQEPPEHASGGWAYMADVQTNSAGYLLYNLQTNTEQDERQCWGCFGRDNRGSASFGCHGQKFSGCAGQRFPGCRKLP